MGSPVAVVRHLIGGTDIMWRFLAAIRAGCFRQFWLAPPQSAVMDTWYKI